MTMENWLLLIDGSNLLYVYAYAMRDMYTSEGVPVGGVFGFFQRMRDLLWEYQDYTAVVVWDGGGDTWRRDVFPAYKAQRKEKDEWVAEQIPKAQALSQCLGVHSVRVRGVEADDLIAFLARRSDRAIIISGDGDFLQLVAPSVSVVRRAHEDPVTIDNLWEEVERVCKVPYKSHNMLRVARGLVGDTSDNIPGVKGVGHKKAYDIIDSYIAAGGSIAPTDDYSGMREMCAQSRFALWRRVDELWHDFEVSLRLTDLTTDDLLPPEHAASLIEQLQWVAPYDLRELLDFVEGNEFPRESQQFGFLQHLLARRCKSIDTVRLERGGQ